MGLSQNVLTEIVRGNVHLSGISAALGQPKSSVINAVQKIKQRGLLLIDAPGTYVATQAGIDWVASGQVIKSGQGSRRKKASSGLRQRAWWVIRARHTVTLPELLSTLADGSEKAPDNNLGRYLKALVQTGFLQVLAHKAPGAAKTSNGFHRYQLARDNGRRAPVVRQAAREVFDPNTGDVFAYGEAKQ